VVDTVPMKSKPHSFAATLRAWAGAVHRSAFWQWATGGVVLANAALLGVLSALPEEGGEAAWLNDLNDAFLAWLVADILLLVLSKGRRVWRNGWDVFDLTVTLLSLVPSIDALSALRMLRVLRVLRLLSFIPDVRVTIEALFGAVHNMAAAFLVLAIVFYCFTIIATNLFRSLDPVHYGSLASSAVYLYATMASFGSNLEAVLPVVRNAPWAWLVFAPFLMLASFGLLNLFIAVLVTALRERLDRKTMLRERQRFDRLESKIDLLLATLLPENPEEKQK
jgi:voltage-gated sodium channel